MKPRGKQRTNSGAHWGVGFAGVVCRMSRTYKRCARGHFGYVGGYVCVRAVYSAIECKLAHEPVVPNGTAIWFHVVRVQSGGSVQPG